MTKIEMIQFRPIGYVENKFNKSVNQEIMRASTSRIVLEPDLVAGLKGLEPGMEIMVIFYFHLSEGYELLQRPHRDRRRPQRGVFALRSPSRPNPIGVTEVELISIEDNILTVQGLDAFNHTPILDLKPM